MKLTKKQMIYMFAVLLFVAVWSAGLLGFILFLIIAIIAFQIDFRRKKRK